MKLRLLEQEISDFIEENFWEGNIYCNLRRLCRGTVDHLIVIRSRVRKLAKRIVRDFIFKEDLHDLHKTRLWNAMGPSDTKEDLAVAVEEKAYKHILKQLKFYASEPSYRRRYSEVA